MIEGFVSAELADLPVSVAPLLHHLCHHPRLRLPPVPGVVAAQVAMLFNGDLLFDQHSPPKLVELPDDLGFHRCFLGAVLTTPYFTFTQALVLGVAATSSFAGTGLSILGAKSVSLVVGVPSASVLHRDVLVLRAVFWGPVAFACLLQQLDFLQDPLEVVERLLPVPREVELLL